MNREQKAATIEALATEIDESQAVFAVDYRGISVAQAAELRSKLREADATFTVVKNSLTERAADQVGAESLKALLSGPTALTFVRGDAALAAKAVADQARATQLLPFKGGLMDGEVVDADQIRAISRLPSREVLYGQLVGIVASPISGLVRTLGGLVGGLAVALGQVREKKESGEIPAGEPPAGEAAPVEEAPAAEAPAAEAPVEEESAVEAPAVEEVPATDEAPVAEESAETPTEDAQAAEEGAAEEQPESEAEVASAAEASTTDQAEPATEPAQDDNQTDASEQEAESAEATKED
ncbi:MAG TPA: 50S ribosomal protein L10 [Solirubrobacteraceae bacterium]|jgi:large subunit ribosomal protein L10|nr:50S ribosomal protein L10 [Solirubrobacteraceae bacterium]